jgi:hypothetical protein
VCAGEQSQGDPIRRSGWLDPNFEARRNKGRPAAAKSRSKKWEGFGKEMANFGHGSKRDRRFADAFVVSTRWTLKWSFQLA